MKCSKCGAEVKEGKFCEECGAELMSAPAEEKPENETEKTKENTEEKKPKNDQKTKKEPASEKSEEKSQDVKDALDNLEKYEQGTIPDPKEKPKSRSRFVYPKNPMLWSFLWLAAFGVVLGILTGVFFNTDLSGKETVFGITFSVFTAAVFAMAFIYYFPAALQLDRLLKGRGVKLEYGLKNYELVDLAEKAKKSNRGFYLAIGLFGLAFSIYYIYILATAAQQTTFMKISLIFSISVFVICAVLFFVMPKFNYGRVMENGSRVIIGSKAVYYGGVYYHWRKIQPDATFGHVNSKKHELELTFTQEFKNGKSRKRTVEVYAPDTALKGIQKLLEEYEENNRKYRAKKEQQSIVNGKPVSK